MRAIDKIKSAARSISATFGRANSGWWGLTPEIAKNIGVRGYGSSMTRSGVHVGPLDSLEVLAFGACVSVISKVMAAIPRRVWRWRNTKTMSGGRDVATDYPLNDVLALKANKRTTAFLWQISSKLNSCVYGDSFSVIDRDDYDQVTALNQHLSPYVEPIRLRNLYQLSEYDDVAEVGDLAYRITSTWPERTERILPASRVLHIPYPFTINGYMGIAPQRIARARIAIGKALMFWESDYFGKGYSPGYIAKGNIKPLPQMSIEETIEYMQQQYAGFKSNHGLFMPGGDIELVQDQHRLDFVMLDQRGREVVEDICGFMGVPPMLICRNWQASYNNSLEFFLQFKKLTIYPHTENDRQAFDSYLLTDAARKSGFHTAYDPKILDMQDGKAWAEMMQTLFQVSAIEPDEIREQANMNPKGGNSQKQYIQKQYVPLEDAGEVEDGNYQESKDGDNSRIVPIRQNARISEG